MRCVAVVGPPHSGKSTLVRQLANLEGKAARTQTSFDVSIVQFNYFGDQWCAIDCPGAIESITHTQNALLASDVAVVCVPPDPEQAVLAAPFLRIVESSGTPCIIFINRMDEPRGRVREIVAALQDYSNHLIVLRQIPIRDGEQISGFVDLISERAWKYRKGQHSALIEIPVTDSEREHQARDALLEQLSEYDDWLLEEIIEDREPAIGPLYAISTKTLQDNKVISTLIGAAENGNGMVRLMKALRHEAPPVTALQQRLAAECDILKGEYPIAVGFHAQHRQHVGKTVFIRAFNEGIASGSTLAGANLGGLVEIGIRNKPASGPMAPGAIAACVKSDQLNVGQIFTGSGSANPPDWAQATTPMVARLIYPQNERDEVKLSSALARLCETDPGLEVAQEEETGAQLIRVQGPMHLRSTTKALVEDFGIVVQDAATHDLYRETITDTAEVQYRHRKQSGGSGQFADVKLSISPNPRGAGYTFSNTVKGGAVPRNFIPSVDNGAREAMRKGSLGFPVIDVAICLLDGKQHSVDSSDYSFRTAGLLGTREAVKKASPILLQPIEMVTFHVPSTHSGSLIPIVSSHHGQVLGFERNPEAKGWDIFRALLPQHAVSELAHEIRSTTQGTGYFLSEFDHFEELYGKEAEKIIEANRQ